MAGKLTGALIPCTEVPRNTGNELVNLGRSRPNQNTEHVIHAQCHGGAWEALYSSPPKSMEKI